MHTDLRQLTNETLLKEAKLLAAEERRITAKLLLFLQEVERRRLFAYLGYSSLFEYVTRELGYSDGSAQRRIASMRLMKQIPSVEEKIQSGSLNLTNVAQAQKFFQNEEKNKHPLTLEEKEKVLLSLEGKSSRETERELLSLSSNPEQLTNQERVKPITSTHSEIRFIVDQNFLDRLEEIRGLLAHRNPNLTMAELMEEMSRITLERLQSRKMAKRMRPEKEEPKKHGATAETGQDADENISVHSGAGSETTSQTQSEDQPKKSSDRYIPAHMKRAVAKRDGGRCTYVDTVSGRRCNSQHAIEYDHIVPLALGGETRVDNLRLLCRTHNQLRAIQAFGFEKMQNHMRK